CPSTNGISSATVITRLSTTATGVEVSTRCCALTRLKLIRTHATAANATRTKVIIISIADRPASEQSLGRLPLEETFGIHPVLRTPADPHLGRRTSARAAASQLMDCAAMRR